jgi:hypothetical protein
MLYKEIIAVSSDIIAKHINAVCRNDIDYMPIKSGPIQSGHWALQRNAHHAVIYPLDPRPVPTNVRVSLDVPSPLYLYIQKEYVFI